MRSLTVLFTLFLAACGGEEQEVVVAEPVVTLEQTIQSNLEKYKTASDEEKQKYAEHVRLHPEMEEEECRDHLLRHPMTIEVAVDPEITNGWTLFAHPENLDFPRVHPIESVEAEPGVRTLSQTYAVYGGQRIEILADAYAANGSHHTFSLIDPRVVPSGERDQIAQIKLNGKVVEVGEQGKTPCFYYLDYDRYKLICIAP
jgi:hypothetical protein